MKKLILAALILMSAVVHAAEITVIEAQLPPMDPFRALTYARFYMDRQSGDGFVKVVVSEERYISRPGCSYDRYGRCLPTTMRDTVLVTVLKETAKIDGLVLEGDKVIYYGAEGAVDCGKMGISRVFKVPTLYLSGNCKLESKVMGRGYNNKLIVTFKTK